MKETLEALDAVDALVVEILKLSKDGLTVADGVALVSNPVLIAKATAAVQGAALIPDEVKHVSPADIQALVARVTVLVGNALGALGVQPGNKALAILPLLPEYAALAQKTHDALVAVPTA